MRQLRLTDGIAAAPGLDRIAGVVRDATRGPLRPGPVKDVLHGVWPGHPLHPALAQLPAGAFSALPYWTPPATVAPAPAG